MHLNPSDPGVVYYNLCGLNLEADLGIVVYDLEYLTKISQRHLGFYLRFQPKTTVNTPSNKSYSEDQCILIFDLSHDILLTRP